MEKPDIEKNSWYWYRRKNPVLAQLSDKECETHYLTYGKSQGLSDSPIIWNEKKERLYQAIVNSYNRIPKDFSVEGYKECNGDLCKESDLFIVYHYVEFGCNEYRSYEKGPVITDFDLQVYRELNRELMCLPENDLKKHFLTFHKQKQKEDKFFNKDFFIQRNNIKDTDNLYKTYLQDIRFFKSKEVETIVLNIPFCKKDYVLVSHENNINGATHSLYIFANFLKSLNKSFIILDVAKNSNEMYMKYNLSEEDFGYYYGDPTILYWYCAKIKSTKIIVNSINFAINAAVQWLDRSNLLLFSRETKQDYMKFSCYEPDVVITPLISNSYNTKPTVQTPICPVFLQETIYKCFDEPVCIEGLDQTKITLGMCGSLTKIKNYDLFLDIAKELPNYNFVWIGGDDLESNLSNVFHVQSTTNPFKYYKLIDYFLLCSEREPFGNVIIENLLLNKKVLTFKHNVYFNFKHELTKNNYFEYQGRFNVPNAIKHINNIATEKQQLVEYIDTPSNVYVRRYFGTYDKDFLECLDVKKIYLNGIRNITDVKTINVKCPMGFCNQLRLLLAGSYLVTNGFIDSYTQEWIINDQNNVDYFTYFKSLPGVKMHPIEERASIKHNNIINSSCFGSVVDFFTKHNVDVKTAFASVISKLVIKEPIRHKIKNFIERFNIPNALGLHLRETDKVSLYSNEQIVYPVDYILDITKPYEVVYLATDNKTTQEIYKNKLGSKLVTFSSIFNNNERERNTEPEHTIADFLILQQCNTFLGTNRSSFSTLIKCARNNVNDFNFVENL